MIKVYQISLSPAECRLLEMEGWDASPKIKAYADRSFDSKFQPAMFKFYEEAAIVAAEDLEEAFKLMNLWEEPERVQKLKLRVPSMSVGDILEKDGEFYRVASWGFNKVEGI